MYSVHSTPVWGEEEDAAVVHGGSTGTTATDGFVKKMAL